MCFILMPANGRYTQLFSYTTCKVYIEISGALEGGREGGREGEEGGEGGREGERTV